MHRLKFDPGLEYGMWCRLFSLRLLFTVFLLFFVHEIWASPHSDLSIFLRIERISGGDTVDIMQPDGTIQQKGVGDKVYVGEIILSRRLTAVQIYMADGSTINIGRNSRYKVEDVRIDESNLLHWSFRLFRGFIHGSVPSRGTQSKVKLKIRTPSGVMGVRGTEFITTYSPKNMSMELFTVEGEVLFSRDGRFSPGHYRTVHSGEYSHLDYYSTEPIFPQEWPTEPLDLFNDSGVIDLLADPDRYLQRHISQREPAAVPTHFSATECIGKNMGWRQDPEKRSGVGKCY